MIISNNDSPNGNSLSLGEKLLTPTKKMLQKIQKLFTKLDVDMAAYWSHFLKICFYGTIFVVIIMWIGGTLRNMCKYGILSNNAKGAFLGLYTILANFIHYLLLTFKWIDEEDLSNNSPTVKINLQMSESRRNSSVSTNLIPINEEQVTEKNISA